MSESNLQNLLDFIHRYKRFLVTGHIRPDGDSIGSALALCSLLNRSGRVAFYPIDAEKAGAPAFLLEGSAAVEYSNLQPFEAVICVDCGSLERLDPRLHTLVQGLPVACIDHHRTNTTFGDVNYTDPTASSTGELIYRLAQKAKWDLTLEEAEALWVSIVTDTGRFAYELTSPDTLRIAAELRAIGVRAPLINDRLYCSFTPKSMELKRCAYNSLRSAYNGLVTTVALNAGDFAVAQASKADAEDVIEIPRSVAGTIIALYFFQTPERPDVTRLSIRTRAPLDATLLAKVYQGGGHLRAAGCDVPLPLADAYEQVLAQLPDLYPVLLESSR